MDRYHDQYLPSPVKKSAVISKLQSRFKQGESSSTPTVRNFRINIDDDDFGCTTKIVPTRTVSSPENLKTAARSAQKYVDRVIQKPLREVVKEEPVSNPEPVKEEHPAEEANVVSRPNQVCPKASAPVVREYKRWDFGKKKTFEVPDDNRVTNAAAVCIQRIARGGMQRLHYKVMQLEHMLDTRQERTDEAIAKINERTQQRKDTFRRKAEQDAKKKSRKTEQVCKTVEESQKLIAYLRRENKKLREKNDKIYEASRNIKGQNDRMEDANQATEASVSILADHFKKIEETHTRLQEIIPKYQESVKTLVDTVEVRDQWCAVEHKIKLMYVKLLGNVVEIMEDAKGEDELAEEVLQAALDLEQHEHAVPMPSSKLHGHLQDSAMFSHCSDDSDLDEYTVHTLQDDE